MGSNVLLKISCLPHNLYYRNLSLISDVQALSPAPSSIPALSVICNKSQSKMMAKMGPFF